MGGIPHISADRGRRVYQRAPHFTANRVYIVLQLRHLRANYTADRFCRVPQSILCRVMIMQRVENHPRAVADPARHTILHAVTKVGFRGLVHQIVVIPARGHGLEIRLVGQVVIVAAEPCRQLHPAATGKVDRVVADAQHLRFLGQVPVLV